MTQNIGSRPTLSCTECVVQPKNEFCCRCFEENYFYFPNVSASVEKYNQSKELRDELRDIFGESDISN